jgi:SAM-dependent methyltransferase
MDQKRWTQWGNGEAGAAMAGSRGMWSLPPNLMALVDEVARQVLGANDAPGPALAHRVRELSSVYTRQAGDVGHASATELAAARLRFFMPRDLLKIWGPLSELHRAGLLPTDRPWRVLDLGAGYGATSLGVAAFAAELGVAEVHLVAVDTDPLALRCLEALASRAEAHGLPRIHLRTARGDASAAASHGEPFDLVTLGFVLNELPSIAARADLVRLAAKQLAEGGSVVILEPALRETSRALEALRDSLLADTAPRSAAEHAPLTVFGPCVHQAPCGMLSRERDWCHEDVPFRLPDPLAAVARDAGLRYEGLTYSYLTLRRSTAQTAEPPSRAAHAPEANLRLRIVSAPLPSKGKCEVWGCGEAGLVKLMRVDRDASDQNAAFSSLRRGAVATVAPSPAKDAQVPPPGAQLRIGRESRVALRLAPPPRKLVPRG